MKVPAERPLSTTIRRGVVAGVLAVAAVVAGAGPAAATTAPEAPCPTGATTPTTYATNC